MYIVKGSVILPLSLLMYILIIQSLCSKANDTLNQTQQLLVDQTLVSARQVFEFGFFNPNGSSNLYLGMWYKNVPVRKIVWVANRDRPLAADDSGLALKIGNDGNLRLLDGKQNTVWLTNVTVQSNNTVVVLQDDGNLVLKDSVSGSTFWESFLYPGDTIVPGLKIGVNRRTGEKLYLSSWKTENDPAPGKFETGLSVDEPPQYITWKSSTPYWRSGPWNGIEFLGATFDSIGYAKGISVRLDMQQGAVYMNYNPTNDSIAIFTLTPSGSFIFMVWREQINQWIESLNEPNHPCDIYGTCGPFGVCSEKETTVCQCLNGFIPRSNEEWSKGNWRGGCVRRTPLLCERNTSNSENDRFQIVSGMKLPDNYAYFSDVNDAESCERRCLSSCTCVAYAYPKGLQCMIWEGNLTDNQLLPHKEAGNLFLRVAYSEIDNPGEEKKPIKLIIRLSTVLSIILLAIFIYFVCRREAIRRGRRRKSGKESVLGDMDLPINDFAKIAVSTNNFSQENKLGEGGFGPVYKGEMENGEHIAVKRLSNHSGQGNEEFKNEVVLISKLQHRNLVKLLGCSIHGEEKLLVYEYFKNKSLDCFIFDSTKRLELDWSKRFHIIQGTARGILYLHRDSRLRVIHRDLKASNILLDDDMNPKISDFGLARSFNVTQELAKTRKIVGTYGYMSPEYAIWGSFSDKSDVYSFGVLLLETVSGRKNTEFFVEEYNLSLLGYAWKLWNENQGLDLLDESLADSSSPSEVIRCVQIGLICVQDQPVDRPTMFDVVLMLGSEKDISQPKQPTFTPQKWLNSTNGAYPDLSSISPNDISLLEGR